MKLKFLESGFFRNNLGQESMSRLLPFMAFFPATIVLMWTHTETALEYYLAAFVIHYGIGKCADAYSSKESK